jgi:hypothetical protein
VKTKYTLWEEIEIAIEAAIREAREIDPKATVDQASHDFVQSNRQLIEPVLYDWAAERVSVRMRSYLRKARKRSPDRYRAIQAKLGFTHLPLTVEIKPGESVPITETTRKTFRKVKGQVRRKKVQTLEPVLEEINKGDALFAFYTKRKKDEHIKWGEILEREATKAIQLGLFAESELPEKPKPTTEK